MTLLDLFGTIYSKIGWKSPLRTRDFENDRRGRQPLLPSLLIRRH